MTVTSGDVVAVGIQFVNDTDAPTILVQGGHLTLRNTRVEETTLTARPAIDVTSGAVDLGTANEAGGNTIVINGDGDLIRNASSEWVGAVGNTFQQDDTTLESNFEIAERIVDATDQEDRTSGGGLVSFVPDTTFLSIDEGVFQVNLLTLTSDLNLSSPSFIIDEASAGTASILTDGKTARFVAFDDGEANFDYSVVEAGQIVAKRTVEFNVRNVAPVVDLGTPPPVNEGQIVSLANAFTDPGSGDTHTFLWTVTSDNGQVIPDSTARDFNFTPQDNGVYTIRYTVTDDDGGVGSDTLSIDVLNQPPQLTLESSPLTIPEGTTPTRAIGANDVPSDTIELSASLGDISPTAQGWEWSYDALDDLSTTTVTITASDEDGGVTSSSFALTVENVAPSLSDAEFSIVENTSGGATLGSVFADDPGADTLTYEITGGSGAAAFQIASSTGQITVAPNAIIDYESATELALEIKVADDDGGTDTTTLLIEILNQPSVFGTVYVDVNQDGVYQANEPGIDHVTIVLRDEQGQLVLDPHGQEITAVTSDGGFYLFEDLGPGTYQLHEQQPTGVTDGEESIGSQGGSMVANDTMRVSLGRTDAHDYLFAELGGGLRSGESAGIGFWQNKHGQALIAQGGAALANWLTQNLGNIFGEEFVGTAGIDIANFYRDQLFKQKAKKSVGGPAKVDAQFMATAFNVYFTNRNLAGNVAEGYGFRVSDTGLGASSGERWKQRRCLQRGRWNGPDRHAAAVNDQHADQPGQEALWVRVDL